jgi:guanylate kinase
MQIRGANIDESGMPRVTTLNPGSMPVLKNREAFEKLLEKYVISNDAKKLLQDTQLVLMVSVTAAGRNTIIENLLSSGRYHNIISDTTRPMRVKGDEIVEYHGVEYYFRPEEDILADLEGGLFVEAAIIHDQQVSGVSVREVLKAHDTGKIAVTDIEVQGCEAILRAKPNTVPIFVLPPSFDEWMRRMDDRSHLPEHEVRNRLKTALIELDIALNDDQFIFVVNDDLDEATKEVDAIAHDGKASATVKTYAHKIAMELQQRVAETLSKM